jgi:hypothetical protein
MHSLNGNMLSKFLPDPYTDLRQRLLDPTLDELTQQANPEIVTSLPPKPIHKGPKTTIKYKRVNGVNCLVLTINVDRKGDTAIEHLIVKTRKIRPELPHIWCFQETGSLISDATGRCEEAEKLTTRLLTNKILSYHTTLSEAETHAILQARNSKRDAITDSTATPRRGGIFTCWN